MSRGTKRSMDTPLSEEQKTKRCSPLVIVFTGGPCAGKSRIMKATRMGLSKRGWQIVTVPECATNFFTNSDGFQGPWVGNKEDLLCIFLRHQVTHEDSFKAYAALSSKPSVILLDRGVLDQKVFTSSQGMWNTVMAECGVTEEALINRYDIVLHLGTCANKGAYEWGPGSNNPGRYHNPDEAAHMDKRCEEVYKGYKDFTMIPYCDKFEDKLGQVIRYLEDALSHYDLTASRDEEQAENLGRNLIRARSHGA